MKIRHLISLASLACASASYAQTIVYSEDFERIIAPPLSSFVSDGTYRGHWRDLADWTVTKTSGVAELLAPNPRKTGGSAWLDPVPSKIKTTFASLSGGATASNDLGITYQANTLYEFSLAAFKRDDFASDMITLSLRSVDKDATVATMTFAAVNKDDTLHSGSVSFSTADDPSYNGDKIQLFIEAGSVRNTRVVFDNLQLTTKPI